MGPRRDVGWCRPDLPSTTTEANRGIESANVKRASVTINAVVGGGGGRRDGDGELIC